MVPRVQKMKVATGPVRVETSFMTDSMEGKGVHFINSRGPRDMLAIALGTMYGACGAAELGASIDDVERLIQDADSIYESYKNLARVLANRNGGVVDSPVSSPVEGEPDFEREIVPQPLTYVEEEENL